MGSGKSLLLGNALLKWFLGCFGLAILCASCGSTGALSKGVESKTSSPSNQTVNLLYAGSLVGAMTNDIGPAFNKATGYHLNGYPGGSVALALQIKEKLQKADVFLSAVPKVNDSLSGASNGNFVSWYADLASSPLVIGYSPKSKFASQLTSSNWYKVMQEPGFRLGRTDPKLDPKGSLTVTLVKEEGSKVGDPSLFKNLLGSSENPAQTFPEETLVGRLESGQLDAGFFYENEAKLAKIPFINTGIPLGANFTISILNRARNLKGAVAFVNFLYSSRGQELLKAVGLVPEKPIVHGLGVPSSVKL